MSRVLANPREAGQADRFGNPFDPIVRYARGTILKGTDEEIARMLLARRLVGNRVRAGGKDSVFDLSGMNRGSGITAGDVPHLTSHVPFFEHFEGGTEPLALKHMGADEAHCVMHCHTTAGVGVASQKQGLLPITQMALTIWGELRYHDYEGVADNEDERARIVEDLGDGTMMLLRNHGTLTVGANVGEAFARMNRIERACRFQLAALTGGAEPNLIPKEVVDYTAQQGREINNAGRAAGGKLLWSALVRKLDREDPGYRQ